MDLYDLIQEGKIKRLFRATKKLNAPGLIFHITQRVAGKDVLFVEDQDYLTMLGLMKEVSEKYSLKILAFCLMPNHVHLLLSPQKENLYDAMRDLFSRYARAFNRKYERKGHLFGGPYRQAVCLGERYLVAASLYIHLNPLRAGLTSDPLLYRWSSCRLYCEEKAPSSFVDSKPILDLLEPSNISPKASYRLLLKQGSNLELSEVLEKQDAIERFASVLASKFPSLFAKIRKPGSPDPPMSGAMPGMDELEAMMDAVKGGYLSRRPESTRAKKYLIEQLLARGYSRGEIAERLGISRKTVYNILNSSQH